MKRRLATLLVVAAPFGLLGVAAPPASACTGAVCNAICDAWNSKVGQKVFGTPCPLN